jgi:hypothetical protein
LGKSLGKLLDAMEADPAWEPLIGPLLQDIAEGGLGVNNGLAWFSVDGVTWEPIADVGPLQGENTIASIVATADGFVATSEEGCCGPPTGPVNAVLWHSVDGTTWTEGAGRVESHLIQSARGLDVWAGQPVAVSDEGVWTIEDSPLQLIPADAIEDIQWPPWLDRPVITMGEFGLIGRAGQHNEEMFYSRDGTSWARWVPTEFDPEDGRLWVVGMGDDFFVMRQGECDPEPEATFCTMWVGTLP